MSVVHGPNIVLSNLVLHVDAANPKSSVNGSSSWNDLSGYRYNGSLINGAAYNSAFKGNILFQGGNNVVTIPSGLTANLLSGFTLETWVAVGNIGDNFSVILTNRDASDNNTTLQLTIDNRGDNNNPWSPNSEKMVVIGLYGNGSNSYYASATPYSGLTNGDGLYHQLAFVFDYPDNLYLYFDGSIVALTGSTYPQAYSSNKIIRVGNQYELNTSDYPLVGNMSIIRIYDRALTPDEVYKNYAGNFSRYSLSSIVPPNPSMTPSNTPTPSITPTISVTPSITPTNTVTPSITPTNTVTPTVTPTNTTTPTLTPTTTPSITPTSTTTPTPTPTSSSVNNNNLLTENGDNLMTEGGDFIEIEYI